MKPGKKNASRHAVNSGEWKLAAKKNKTSKDVSSKTTISRAAAVHSQGERA
jgi:hypothetical protein